MSWTRQHQRSCKDAYRFITDGAEERVGATRGKSVMSAPGHKLYRWENARGESVSVVGRGEVSPRGFDAYAVAYAGHVVAETDSLSAATDEAAKIRRAAPRGPNSDELARAELVSFVAHFDHGLGNPSHASEGELREWFVTNIDADADPYPPRVDED